MDGGGANNQAVVLAVDGYNQNTSDTMGAIRAGKADQDHVGCVVYPDTARALTASYDSSPCDDRGQNVVVQPALFMAGALAAEPGMKQQTFIAQPVIALQANGIDRALTAGCNGAGWRENEMYTLNTIDRHAVAFEQHLFNKQRHDEYAVCGVASTESARQYKDATDLVVEQKQAPPARRYIVRRLTPTECLRLQGYPDEWCDITPAIERAGEQMLFWNEVRSTVAKITSKAAPRALASADAARAYVSKLKTDATIYKAAGNSLAEPCARQVLYRIMTIGFKVCPSCRVRLSQDGTCIFCGRKYEL
jgi:hypothetical protein